MKAEIPPHPRSRPSLGTKIGPAPLVKFGIPDRSSGQVRHHVAKKAGLAAGQEQIDAKNQELASTDEKLAEEQH